MRMHPQPLGFRCARGIDDIGPSRRGRPLCQSAGGRSGHARKSSRSMRVSAGEQGTAGVTQNGPLAPRSRIRRGDFCSVSRRLWARHRALRQGTPDTAQRKIHGIPRAHSGTNVTPVPKPAPQQSVACAAHGQASRPGKAPCRVGGRPKYRQRPVFGTQAGSA